MGIESSYCAFKDGLFSGHQKDSEEKMMELNKGLERMIEDVEHLPGMLSHYGNLYHVNVVGGVLIFLCLSCLYDDVGSCSCVFQKRLSKIFSCGTIFLNIFFTGLYFYPNTLSPYYPCTTHSLTFHF